jgi:holo-[acyl-carrier protein] synthase
MIYLLTGGGAMIIGTGIDIIETARVKTLLDSGGIRFRERCFGEEEIAYCEAKANPHLHYAARLAAKEAAAKALKLSREAPLAWSDITVTVKESGAPALVLRGAPQDAALSLGVQSFHLSLSHCALYATASVIAEGASPSS